MIIASQPFREYSIATVCLRSRTLSTKNIPAIMQSGNNCVSRRKNWLFSSSVEGANASAAVYTMVEMAKANGLNIYEYLKFLLEHRPSKDMTNEQLAELAPWSEKLQSIKNRM